MEEEEIAFSGGQPVNDKNMTIEQAILKARYKNHGSDEMYTDTYGRTDRESKFAIELFLDPSFWRSLGKALGWTEGERGWMNEDEVVPMMEEWKSQWVNFVLHLAEGKDAESFFQALAEPDQKPH